MPYDPMGSYGGRTKNVPIPIARSRRTLDIRGLTSVPVGKVVPIAAFGLLREDKVDMTRFQINVEMKETVELLVNPPHVRVMAWLIPKLAFERFNGIDQLNRSYMKEPETEGGAVIPYIETMSMNRVANEIMVYLGKHAREGQQITTDYVEAYNTMMNFRARNRSPDIPLRSKLQSTLARAYWINQRFGDIVPDFDQATIEGAIPLTGKAPVSGLGMFGAAQSYSTVATTMRETGKAAATSVQGWQAADSASAGKQPLIVRGVTGGFPAIYAELADAGVTLSLSNIELAQKTRAFAALRKQYEGLNDDYIIDLLMNGISVPEQEWRDPMLLADTANLFGMSKRYATTADDLTASVVNGGTTLQLAITTPRCPTGGVVMLTMEVTPEQLYERQADPYLLTLDQDKYPSYLRDTLDPEKVSIVPCEYVDIDHDTPTAVFGYTYLNAQWNRCGPNIGGKFYRPTVDAAFDEDRQRLWAVETQNPTLAEDFYLCTDMHQKPFVETDIDNFETVTRGVVSISGNTVFGRMLVEASDTYTEIMDEVDMDRIDKVDVLSVEDTPSIEGEV